MASPEPSSCVTGRARFRTSAIETPLRATTDRISGHPPPRIHLLWATLTIRLMTLAQLHRHFDQLWCVQLYVGFAQGPALRAEFRGQIASAPCSIPTRQRIANHVRAAQLPPGYKAMTGTQKFLYLESPVAHPIFCEGRFPNCNQVRPEALNRWRQVHSVGTAFSRLVSCLELIRGHSPSMRRHRVNNSQAPASLRNLAIA